MVKSYFAKIEAISFTTGEINITTRAICSRIKPGGMAVKKIVYRGRYLSGSSELFFSVTNCLPALFARKRKRQGKERELDGN